MFRRVTPILLIRGPSQEAGTFFIPCLLTWGGYLSSIWREETHLRMIRPSRWWFLTSGGSWSHGLNQKRQNVMRQGSEPLDVLVLVFLYQWELFLSSKVPGDANSLQRRSLASCQLIELKRSVESMSFSFVILLFARLLLVLSAEASISKPNIIIFVADDWGMSKIQYLLMRTKQKKYRQVSAMWVITIKTHRQIRV